MASSISDSERRMEIARRTREGLEEDFQDIRSELSGDLEEFEARIREAAQRAPDWISVDPRGVVELFEVEDDDLPEPGFLGPRMVAIAAGVAEEFVTKWLPDSTEDEDREFDEETLEEFERDLREMFAFFDDVEEWTRVRAGRAHRILEEWMETNLAYLDELRENDIEALKDLVGEGSLETGPDARAERAQLWDEQRKRADELADIWDDLHELIDRGTAETRDGLEEVRSLLHRACQGLAGSYPGLERAGLVEELFAEAESVETAETRVEQGGEDRQTDQQWLREVDESSEEAEASSDEERGPEAETAPLNLGRVDSNATGNRRVPEQSEIAEEPTEPPTPTDPVVEAGADAARPPQSDGESEGTSNSASSTRAETGAEEPPEEETSTESEPDSASGEGDDEEDVADSEESDADAVEREASERDAAALTPGTLRTKCLRIREQRQVVEWSAIAAALGPPAGFLLAMVGVSVAYLVGVESAVNPVAAWSWVEAAVGVALAWFVLAPLLLGWRPRWEGWSFAFVHEADVREETTLEIDAEGFALGRVSLRWDGLRDYRRRRWQTSDGEMAGWLFVLESDYYEPVRLIAPVEDREEWRAAPSPVVEPPADAWQVNPAAIERLRRFLSTDR